MVNGFYSVLFYDVSNIIRPMTAKLSIKNFGHFAVTYQSVAHRFMIGKLQTKPFSNFFKGMAKWPVPKIVD